QRGRRQRARLAERVAFAGPSCDPRGHMRGSAMLGAFAATLLFVAGANIAPPTSSASGFPDHDPQREVVVHGRVRDSDSIVGAKATMTGKWSDQGGRLVPVFGAAPGEQLWFPAGRAAHVGNGTIRVRIDPGAGLDMSVLLRQRYEGDPPAV